MCSRLPGWCSFVLSIECKMLGYRRRRDCGGDGRGRGRAMLILVASAALSDSTFLIARTLRIKTLRNTQKYPYRIIIREVLILPLTAALLNIFRVFDFQTSTLSPLNKYSSQARTRFFCILVSNLISPEALP